MSRISEFDHDRAYRQRTEDAIRAEERAAIVAWLRAPVAVPSAEWVLECGCEPGHTHCEQCDLRRSQRKNAQMRAEMQSHVIADAIERGGHRKEQT